MAEPILHKSPPNKSKKINPKLKKLATLPASTRDENQKPDEAFIMLYREELFQLHDVAEELKLLRDIAREAPEMQIIAAEILIKKTSRCAWNLIHETLDSRWADTHPDVDLIRKD
jgi:hypothetical protein